MAIPTEFELTFACGHVGTIDLSALPADRRGGRLEFLRAKGVCNDCYEDTRAKRRQLDTQRWAAKQRKAEATEAADWAVEHGFPPLTGTPKQSDYAARVRFELLRDLYQWSVQESRDPAGYARAEASARHIDEARWWLDQKHLITDPGDLLELLEVAVASHHGQTCENSA
jgi:hypothetical protein